LTLIPIHAQADGEKEEVGQEEERAMNISRVILETVGIHLHRILPGNDCRNEARFVLPEFASAAVGCDTCDTIDVPRAVEPRRLAAVLEWPARGLTARRREAVRPESRGDYAPVSFLICC